MKLQKQKKWLALKTSDDKKCHNEKYNGVPWGYNPNF